MTISIRLRENILSFLVVITLVSFTISYAVNSMAMFLFLVFFFFDTRANIKNKIASITKNKLVLIYILFFLVQLMGCLYSYNSQMAFRRVAVMLPLLFLPAVLSVETLKIKHLKLCLKLVKVLIPLTFAVLLLYHLFFLKRTFNTFVNFTLTEVVGVSQFYLAFILLIPIIECLRQIILKGTPLLNILLIGFNLLIIFLLGNKTSLVFLLVLLVFLGFNVFVKNKPKKFLLLLLACFTTIVLASQLQIVKNRVEVLFKTTDFNFTTIVTKNKYTITKNTLEHRVLIDYVAISAIVKALPFGYGTGDYLEVLHKGYQDLNFKAGIHYKYNAHNQYLEEFLKTGVLGGILFIILIAALLKKMNKTNYYTYLIGFFAMACCFESYLFRQHGVVILGFLLPFIIYNTHKLHTP